MASPDAGFRLLGGADIGQYGAAMNRRIIEIDSEVARLRQDLAETQNRIQALAEERGKVLAAMENDTAFLRRVRGESAATNGSR